MSNTELENLRQEGLRFISSGNLGRGLRRLISATTRGDRLALQELEKHQAFLNSDASTQEHLVTEFLYYCPFLKENARSTLWNILVISKNLIPISPTSFIEQTFDLSVSLLALASAEENAALKERKLNAGLRGLMYLLAF